MADYAKIPEKFGLCSLTGLDDAIALGITIDDNTYVFDKQQCKDIIIGMTAALDVITFEHPKGAYKSFGEAIDVRTIN